ncbi:ATPase [bacterium]|nr:ATPase [bacterium]
MMGLAVILSSCGRATNPAANSQSAKLMERPGSAGVRSLTRPSSYVHLFEWTWRDVAKECEKVLGPAGVDAVQISPPQEHRLMPGSPWFQRYQPVSYRLESRSGTRAEFIDMVNRCQKAGVDVISDAVVNHMAQTLPFNQSETGWAGSSYSRYNYPGLFAFADFHHCGRYSDNVIRNYQDRWEVQNCELLGLADLNTGNDSVRGKIADFLNDQLSIGVRGFRIDAAKHMAPGDIGAIVSQLRNSPFVFQEVIDQGGEPVSAIEYLDNGSVTEFRVGLALAALFRRGNLSALGSMGESWGFVPSRKAVVFTDNHDNQRGHGGGGPVLTYRDGTLHTLANLFLLGFNYGSVGIMSSYDFSRESDGPPVNSDGQTRPVYTEAGLSNCGKGQWICEHRDTTLLSMLKFRRTVGSAPVIKWWSSESGAQIAFSRGDQGWFALNIEGKSSFVSVQTSLPDGLYCDSLSGMKYAGDPKSCSGQRVEIRDGTAQVVIPGMSAVAITLQERINFN